MILSRGIVYLLVPKDAVQDFDDHCVVSLGDVDDAIRIIMAARANWGKVAAVGTMQAVMLEGSE